MNNFLKNNSSLKNDERLVRNKEKTKNIRACFLYNYVHVKSVFDLQLRRDKNVVPHAAHRY